MKFSHKTYEVGYSSGVFDMFHVGHLNLIRSARTRCKHLIVGVASDEYAESIKGQMPVVPFDERMEIISALGMVDEVIVDRSQDKTEVWQHRNFDVIFKGSDWQGSPKGYQLERSMAAVGSDVVYFPYTEHTSSSILRSYLTQSLDS